MEFVSQGCFKLTGYVPEDLISNNIISYGNVILPEDFKDLWLNVQKALENKDSFNKIYRIRTKDNQIRWVWEQGVGVYNSKGEVEYLEGFITDITDRVEFEERLKQSEEKYSALINNLQEGIWTIDKNEYTTFMNPKMCEILGYSSEEIMGKHLFDFMNEDSKLIAINNLEKGRMGNKETYVFEFVKKDGSPVYTSIATSPIIDREGNYIGAMAGVQDITKRIRYEKTIEQLNDNLRLLNKILRHDITNALTVLSISLEMIETKNEDMKYLAFSSIDKCVNLIKRLRSLESEMLTYYELKPFSIKEIIEYAKKNYSNVTIHMKEDCIVLADESLVSVISNVIDNSIIHSKTDKIDIMIDSDEDICELLIIDYGKGIPKDVKNRIFEEGASFGETAGTGLGLYIVKKNIERYGGTIEVKDTIPKGSTFILKLKSIKE